MTSNNMVEAGEIAQPIKELIPLAKSLGSIPSTHKLTSICNSSRGPITLFSFPWQSAHTKAKHPYTGYKKQILKIFKCFEINLTKE